MQRCAAGHAAGALRPMLLLPRPVPCALPRAAAARQQHHCRRPPSSSSARAAGRGAPPPPPPTQEKKKEKKKKKGWRVLDGQAYLERWDVPWSGGAAAGWMLGWFATFALSAFVLSPALYFTLFPLPPLPAPPPPPPPQNAAPSPPSGAQAKQPPPVLRVSSLPPSEQAQFALASEAVEASVTAALLGAVAARHGSGGVLSARGVLQLFGPPAEDDDEEEEEGGQEDVKRARGGAASAAAGASKQQKRSSGSSSSRSSSSSSGRPARAFQAPRGWLGWGLLGALAAPVVVGSTAALLSFLHYDEYFAAGKGTADAVAGMVETSNGGDDAAAAASASALALVTYVRLFAVTAILAPLLEESVFRGFLLPTLTKYLPVPAAVVLSSAAFAAAHLSARDAPVLFALGCLLGLVYVRSRALASPMLVHGLWNGTVLSVLFALSASGVDLDAMLHPAPAAAGGAAAAAGPAADVALQWMRAMMVVW
jgi:membrane protease YdiL (CAAX protease family)